MPEQSQRAWVRYALGGLLAFGALNAFAGGYLALSGAKGVPREWLADSPFTNYFIPGLILTIVIGGSLLVAAILVFARKRGARPAAFSAGIILLIWMTVEMAIIGYVSWMQPVTLACDAAVLALAWALPRFPA